MRTVPPPSRSTTSIQSGYGTAACEFFVVFCAPASGVTVMSHRPANGLPVADQAAYGRTMAATKIGRTVNGFMKDQCKPFVSISRVNANTLDRSLQFRMGSKHLLEGMTSMKNRVLNGLALGACLGLVSLGCLSAQETPKFTFNAGAGFTTPVGK